jgi:hypothetical protein
MRAQDAVDAAEDLVVWKRRSATHPVPGVEQLGDYFGDAVPEQVPCE